MSDPLTPRHYVLAQDIKAGQTFVHGRGGKHWTALADADSTNMRRHGQTGDLLVSVPVSFRGTVQGMPLGLPLDKIVRIVPTAETKDQTMDSTNIGMSILDSESEDYDQLPSAPVATALLIGTALFAIPVAMASIVIVPAAIAGRLIVERFRR